MTKTNDNYFKRILSENDLCLAPLAGVTDMPFRAICMEQGAGLMTTEMISAKGLYYNNAATKELMALHPDEKKTGIQIFGSEPYALSEAVKRYCNDSSFAFIDINMGCPVRKIISNGDGSALLSDEKKMAEVAEAVVQASVKPVSVKIRIGISASDINCARTVSVLQDCGVTAITVHGRTRTQMYAGKANLDEIAKAVSTAEIPIIGNGDVSDAASYLRMKETGCAGVMIGRAAMGNPFIFDELIQYKSTGTIVKIADREKLDTALRHFQYLLDFKNEYLACTEFRKHLSWYTKGMPNSAKLRHDINSVRQKEELFAIIEELKKTLE